MRELLSGILAGELGSLVNNVDAIEELTFVLLADFASLGNLGAGKRNSGVVATENENLILSLFGELGGDTRLHVDLVHVSTTQEVIDLNSLATILNFSVNGEMGINALELVLVGLYNKKENAALL